MTIEPGINNFFGLMMNVILKTLKNVKIYNYLTPISHLPNYVKDSEIRI